MGMHTYQTKGCRWPTLLRKRQLRCWPLSALPWLISTTESQLTTPYNAPYSSAAFRAALSRETSQGAGSAHLGEFQGESCTLDSHRKAGEQPPGNSHGSSRLRELAWNNNTTHFSLTFPNEGNRKSSQAIGRTREGHHIFICHELCLGEQQAQQAITHQSRFLLCFRALHYTEALTGRREVSAAPPFQPLSNFIILLTLSLKTVSWKEKYFFYCTGQDDTLGLNRKTPTQHKCASGKKFLC